MAKKIKLELTEAQFRSFIDVVDTISGQIGCDFEFSEIHSKNVKLIDRMLLKNGYKRKYK